MGQLGHLAWFATGLAAMTAVTITLAWRAGIGLGWFPLWALLRAGIQLTVIALLLRGILAVPATVAAFVLLMASTASWTAAHRLEELWHGRRAAVAGVLAGAAVSLVAVFGLRLGGFPGRFIVAGGGVVIGHAVRAPPPSGREFIRRAPGRPP